ncbi:hypothetical protein C0991_002870 [Blastosporella zonata]|nr:hypothetical protein C0991_002870 [Blastosporella zonata]
METEDSLQKDESDQKSPILFNPAAKRLNSTWRLPEWVNFSYATVQHRPYHPRHRSPNPFRPQSEEFPRSDLKSQDVERVPRHASEAPRGSSINEFPWGGVSRTRETGTYQPFSNALGTVVNHPPPVPWDDETTVDLPYDNPFYTKAFDNVLWLPRDPFGTLDLNDTIDLRVSLCVDPIAGQLGSWLGLDDTSSSPEEIPQGPNLNQQPSQISLRPVNGTEDIVLPPVIARRVNSRESDMEWTMRPRRPSNYHRKFSGATTSSGENGVQPSVLRRDSLLGDNRSPGRARSSSVLSLTSSHLQSRSQVLGQNPALQIHAEVLVPTNASTSRLSHVSPSTSNNVTTRQAIFNEVLAEERAAMVDQIEDEAADTQKAASSKSWLTAWMFNRRE